jgi:SAM-dependent methyltransferase
VIESSHKPPPATLLFRPIHPFPARMAPKIVWDQLRSTRNPKGMTILDPMAGSGTTIVTARMLGHHALAFDTDPLAVLIARAWSADVDPAELTQAGARVLRSARQRARGMPVGDAYPANSDDETRRFVRYWFDETPRKHLTGLAAAIEDEEAPSIRMLLWCAFSRLIIVKNAGASRAMDVSHSRPHRVYERAPLKPFDGFERAVRVVAKNAPFSDNRDRPQAAVHQGDARKLPVQDTSVDVVVTSPPYLNAIDYLRGHKFSLIWMGHGVGVLREVRATNVGTEVSAGKSEETPLIRRAITAMGTSGLPAREVGMLRRYAQDMGAIFVEIARVLKPKGRAILVVGDSTIRGKFVENSRGLTVLARAAGLDLLRRRTRPLPPNRRYLPPPEWATSGENLEARMRDEVILTFNRPAD